MRVTIAVATILAVFSTTAWADEVDPKSRALVDEVLEVTGALDIGEQMSSMIVTQMVQAMKATNNTLPERAFDVMAEEVNATISEEIASGSFQELMYPIYLKYLTVEELEAMVAFYRSPEGQRIAEVLPAMSQEGMIAGQQWGAALGPEIARRVRQRLDDEGFSLE